MLPRWGYQKENSYMGVMEGMGGRSFPGSWLSTMLIMRYELEFSCLVPVTPALFLINGGRKTFSTYWTDLWHLQQVLVRPFQSTVKIRKGNILMILYTSTTAE